MNGMPVALTTATGEDPWVCWVSRCQDLLPALSEVLNDSALNAAAQISRARSVMVRIAMVRIATVRTEVTLTDSALILRAQDAKVAHSCLVAMVLQVRCVVHSVVLHYAVARYVVEGLRCVAEGPRFAVAVRYAVELHFVAGLRFVVAELQPVKVEHYVVGVRRKA